MRFCDDGAMKDDDMMKPYYDTCQKAMGLFDYDFDLGIQVGGYLERTDFENVGPIKRKMPLEIWVKDKTLRLVGLCNQEAALLSVSSILAKPFAALGMSDAEKEVWSAKIKAPLKEILIHPYYRYCFWYAQKPEKVV